MRLFGNKRGIIEDLHVYLIQLILMLGFSIIIIAFVSNALKNTTFEKAYITRDLALISNAIIASPGNVFYEYNISDYNFQIAFIYKKVIARGEDGKHAIYYSYATDSNYVNKDYPSERISKELDIAKEGNVFRVNRTLSPSLNAIDCSIYGNESINPKRILIDIPHDATNPGYKTETENIELLKTCGIGNYLLHQKNPSIQFSFTHPIDVYGNLDCNRRYPVVMPPVDYVVVIHGGVLMSRELSPVKAYVVHNSAREKESLRLACQLVNSILSSEKLEKFTGSALILAEPSLTNPHIQIENIDPAISTIVLEIGNINLPKEKNQLFSQDAVGESIVKGLNSND